MTWMWPWRTAVLEYHSADLLAASGGSVRPQGAFPNHQFARPPGAPVTAGCAAVPDCLGGPGRSTLDLGTPGATRRGSEQPSSRQTHSFAANRRRSPSPEGRGGQGVRTNKGPGRVAPSPARETEEVGPDLTRPERLRPATLPWPSSRCPRPAPTGTPAPGTTRIAPRRRTDRPLTDAETARPACGTRAGPRN